MSDIAPLGCQSNDEKTSPPSAIGTTIVLCFILMIITTMMMDFVKHKMGLQTKQVMKLTIPGI